jgi:hypothetical protein
MTTPFIIAFPSAPSSRPDALPVVVDLDWHGRILTSDNRGIVNNGHVIEPSEVLL